MNTIPCEYKPTEEVKFERTCEYQILNPQTKQIWCDWIWCDWFYKYLSEPYQQMSCHFPECNSEKCPKKGERKNVYKEK